METWLYLSGWQLRNCLLIWRPFRRIQKPNRSFHSFFSGFTKSAGVLSRVAEASGAGTTRHCPTELPCVPGILFLGVDWFCKFLLLFTWGLWRSLFSVYNNMCLLIAWWHATAKLLLLEIKKGKIDIYGDLGAGWSAALDFYCSWLHTCQTWESASHCGELVSISVWIPLLGFGLHSVRLAMCRFTQTNMQFMSADFTGT